MLTRNLTQKVWKNVTTKYLLKNDEKNEHYIHVCKTRDDVWIQQKITNHN